MKPSLIASCWYLFLALIVLYSKHVPLKRDNDRYLYDGSDPVTSCVDF